MSQALVILVKDDARSSKAPHLARRDWCEVFCREIDSDYSTPPAFLSDARSQGIDAANSEGWLQNYKERLVVRFWPRRTTTLEQSWPSSFLAEGLQDCAREISASSQGLIVRTKKDQT